MTKYVSEKFQLANVSLTQHVNIRWLSFYFGLEL